MSTKRCLLASIFGLSKSLENLLGFYGRKTAIDLLYLHFVV